jgi:outer membrane biosynthesis protein TonB
MKRHFQRYRDDRFALTTLQNPDLEVRTYAELVQAAQQEREWQPTAVRTAATQPLATPDAPDSIPVSELPAIELSAAPPEPEPPALAPLDAAPPAPKPRHKTKKSPKSKSRRKSKPLQSPALARALAFLSTADNTDATAPQDDQPDEYQDSEQDESPELTAAERHARKCSICSHPHREVIEQAFLQWRSPDTIKHAWDISSRTAIYRHAHAFNLFALRNRNLQFALGNIIEEADNHNPTTRDVLNAIRILAHVNEEGRWVPPTTKSEVIFSTQRLPAVAGLPACRSGRFADRGNSTCRQASVLACY